MFLLLRRRTGTRAFPFSFSRQQLSIVGSEIAARKQSLVLGKKDLRGNEGYTQAIVVFGTQNSLWSIRLAYEWIGIHWSAILVPENETMGHSYGSGLTVEHVMISSKSMLL